MLPGGADGMGGTGGPAFPWAAPGQGPGGAEEPGGYLRALGARLPQELDGAAAVGPLAPAVVPGEAAARVPLQAVAEVLGRDRVLQEAAAEAEVSGGSCRRKGGERRPRCPPAPNMPLLPRGTCRAWAVPLTAEISPSCLPFPSPGRKAVSPRARRLAPTRCLPTRTPRERCLSRRPPAEQTRAPAADLRRAAATSRSSPPLCRERRREGAKGQSRFPGTRLTSNGHHRGMGSG